MLNPVGESDRRPLRPVFDRRPKLEFHGSRGTSDADLLAFRERDDALGLTAMAADLLADTRTGKNGWHGFVGLLRLSVYGRLAGYEDVNDADRLGHDPAIPWIVDGKAVERCAASASQMDRFETRWLAGRSSARPVTQEPSRVARRHASLDHRWARAVTSPTVGPCGDSRPKAIPIVRGSPTDDPRATRPAGSICCSTG